LDTFGTQSAPTRSLPGAVPEHRPNPLGLHRVTVREICGTRFRIAPQVRDPLFELHRRPFASGALQGAVRDGVLQRRSGQDRTAPKESRADRSRSEQVVRQRRGGRRTRDRPRDRSVREQHLQVLPQLPTGSRSNWTRGAAREQASEECRRRGLGRSMFVASNVECNLGHETVGVH
jgi:hypothetical protein